VLKFTTAWIGILVPAITPSIVGDISMSVDTTNLAGGALPKQVRLVRSAWRACCRSPARRPSSGVPARRRWCGMATIRAGSSRGSCENEAVAPQAAAGYCARFNKYGRITAVTRQYGNYISFNCLWSPDADRYSRPAVATRATCSAEHVFAKLGARDAAREPGEPDVDAQCVLGHRDSRSVRPRFCHPASV